MFGKKKKVNAAVDGQPVEANVEPNKEEETEMKEKKISKKAIAGIVVGVGTALGVGGKIIFDILRSRKGLDSEFNSAEGMDFTDDTDPSAADGLDL